MVKIGDENVFNDGIYVSIKILPMSKIIQGLKNYEFRNYVPKKSFKFLYVYVSASQSELKYIIEVGDIVKYPSKIENNGIGNNEFNLGKKTKYAYQIKKVYELLKPISLKELKDTYSFTPPQAFSYSETYEKLTKDIKNAENSFIIR